MTQGDAAEWLQAKLAKSEPGHLRMVYHTVAWQYFSPAVRLRCEAALQRAGAAANAEAPLAHVAMDAGGEGPGAELTLRLCNGIARAWLLGRADFHGRWVDWHPVER